MKRSVIAVVATALVVSMGCQGTATVPETGRQRQQLRYSEQEMAVLGVEAYKEVLAQYEVVEAGAEADMVRSVGERLAAVTGKSESEGYSWEFKLLKADETINAFCLPGGKVAVFTGLLPVCEGEQGLSVVLSHEIAHAILQHSNERMSQGSLKTLIGLPAGMVTNVWGSIAPASRKAVMDGLGLGAVFGRALPWDQHHESEADKVGLRYMQDASFDLEEAPKFWERMVEASPPGGISDSLSTHPASAERAAELRAEVERMKAKAKAPGGA